MDLIIIDRIVYNSGGYMKKEQKTIITKNKILAKALEEFGENGYSGTSLNTICKEGISKGLFYHNFQSKDAVYLECVKESFNHLIAYIKNQEIGTDPKKYMEARLQFFQTYPSHGRIFFEAILQPPHQLKKEIGLIKEQFDQLNIQIYQGILSTLTLRKGVTKKNAMNYFSIMQAMFNGYFSSPIYQNLSQDEWLMMHEDYLLKMIDFMLYGIADRG